MVNSSYSYMTNVTCTTGGTKLLLWSICEKEQILFCAPPVYQDLSVCRYWPANLHIRAQLFEGRLALNPGFLFLCSKAFPRIIFSVLFRASNHQLVDKKN